MNKSDNHLSNEILDTPLDEGKSSLEKVKEFAKDNLFYVVAGTFFLAGTGHYAYDYHSEFNFQVYLNGNGILQAPTREFTLGFISLLLIFGNDVLSQTMTKGEVEKETDDFLNEYERALDKKTYSKTKVFTLVFYGTLLYLSIIYGLNNQKLFDQGLQDGRNVETLSESLDEELIDNIYYRSGSAAGVSQSVNEGRQIIL